MCVCVLFVQGLLLTSKIDEKKQKSFTCLRWTIQDCIYWKWPFIDFVFFFVKQKGESEINKTNKKKLTRQFSLCVSQDQILLSFKLKNMRSVIDQS